MHVLCWRIEPLETPAWLEACSRCSRIRPHVSTQRFRVNSRGRRHDVWLIYRCAVCGTTRKRRLARRRREAELSAHLLERYRADDPLLALRHAFEVQPAGSIAHRVVRETLPAARPLQVRIDQPLFCSVRWDRLLASVLACSRGRVQRAWLRGELRVANVARSSLLVRDGDSLQLHLGDPNV